MVTWIQPMHGNLARNTIASKTRVLRMFLCYLQNKGISVYIPRYIKVPDTYIPHLFSDAEIRALFTAADSIPHRKKSKHAIVLPMALRMLYSCGFRLGELLAIKVGDIDFKRNLVILRDTKNHKQRVVPLGDALTEMVYKYCLAMGVMECAENYIFPGKDRTKHISQRAVQEWFRHLFAVKSFAQAELAGRSVNDSIPYLSVYLGHNNLTETEKYLKFNSDIFPEHTALFENFSEGIFPEVCYEE